MGIFDVTVIQAQSNDSSKRIYFKTTLDTPNYTVPTETVTKYTVAHQFVIRLLNNSISVKYQNKSLPISTIQQLDEYLKRNSKKIYESKVELQRFQNSPFEEFKAVIAVLAKYKITRFGLVMIE